MLASLKHHADMDFLSMFSPQRQLLGLDIGSSSIKLVQIKEHRVLALASSLLSALGMYAHQRLGGSNAATAVWLKIIPLMIAVPVVIEVGRRKTPFFICSPQAPRSSGALTT